MQDRDYAMQALCNSYERMCKLHSERGGMYELRRIAVHNRIITALRSRGVEFVSRWDAIKIAFVIAWGEDAWGDDAWDDAA